MSEGSDVPAGSVAQRRQVCGCCGAILASRIPTVCPECGTRGVPENDGEVRLHGFALVAVPTAMILGAALIEAWLWAWRYERNPLFEDTRYVFWISSATALFAGAVAITGYAGLIPSGRTAAARRRAAVLCWLVALGHIELCARLWVA